MRIYISVVAVFSAHLLCSGAANCEPLAINTPVEWAVTGSLPSSVREIAGVRLSVDTLDGIQKRFGKAKRFRTNNGAAADDFLCYQSKSHKFLVVGSGPMGGWSTVTTIAYGVAAPTDIRRNCVASDMDIDKVGTASWLKNLPALEKVVRKKTKATQDGVHHVRFEREIKPTKGDKDSLFCASGIQATTEKSKVIVFTQVWESCSK